MIANGIKLLYERELLSMCILKVHGAILGPSRADGTQMGPMLAPWTLLPG